MLLTDHPPILETRSLLWPDEAACTAFAAQLARTPTLFPSTFIALAGPLGAGKTAFVKGLAEGLGLDPQAVASPTFTIASEYPAGARQRLVHADLYRLKDPSLLLGQLEAALEGARLGLVEWGEPHLLGASHLLRLSPEGEARRAELWEVGPGEEKGV